MNSLLGRLRLVGLLEGWSLLILLFVCMPLKYVWDLPQGVQIIGMLHGLLFILYVVQIFVAMVEFKWKLFQETFWLLLASILPFGTFVADRKILIPLQVKLKNS